jgi:signal transduction histidine kinase
MRSKLSLLALAGVIAAGVAVWLAATGTSNDRPTEPGPVLTLVVGASLIGSGLASWYARPENRLGRAMVLTGFLWFASLLVEARGAAVSTIGELVQYAWIIGFFYIVLSFPSGRLRGRVDRVVIAAGVVIAVGLEIPILLFGNRPELRSLDLLQAFSDNHAATFFFDLQRITGGVVTVATIALLLTRWLRASGPERRAVAPVLLAGGLTLLALTTTIINDLASDPWNALPAEVHFYATATVPIAVMWVFLQRRLAQGHVAGLVVELGQPSAVADLREALARALGDPSLELAYWFPAEARYVDADGHAVALPDGTGGRRATFVERDGQPIAALLHDPALEHNIELVHSVCAAAGLALENERLHAELRARLTELQASRARLVGATDAERRRIERDLHDGTQQRLISIAMSLGLLESKLPVEPAAASPIVAQTREELALALAELRELTHGIHPPLLAERGLSAALEELCRRAALPAYLACTLDSRLPDQVEGAAYFFASEALANAAKHSHASEVRIAAHCDGGTLTVEVADDGIGGAATGDGSGLRGLADRVEALSGRFTLSSPPGRGTTLRAEIPCG